MRAAQGREWDPRDYGFGQIIPTYGLPADPLEQNCLASMQIYSLRGCKGVAVNSVHWSNVVENINLVSTNSSYCLTNYDFDGDGTDRYDIKARCSNRSLVISFYKPNSNCRNTSFVRQLEGVWGDRSEVCVDGVGAGQERAYGFARNDSLSL